MKGVVFTEFLDFVESSAGEAVVDRMIEEAAPPSGGCYTAVGWYEFEEMALLIGALARILDRPAPRLIRAFGAHLFHRLVALHPVVVDGVADPLDFLERLDREIHVEVKKLYPDAELPSLKARRLDAHALELDYRSCRPLGELCLGLIEGCADYFNTTLQIEATPHERGLTIAVRHQEVARALPHDPIPARA